MEVMLGLLAGLFVGVSVYLMMNRSIIRFVFGLVLISNAANLVLFAAGRTTRAEPALIPAGALAPLEDVANGLPQALILTAIVIGFGLLAFALVLVLRAYQEMRTIDSEAMRAAEPEDLYEDGSKPAGGSSAS